MSTNRWFLLIALLTFSCSFVVGRYVSNQLVIPDQEVECVITTPLVCVSSRIHYAARLFYAGPTEYHLWFKGKRSEGGDECQVMRYVTESTYDQWVSY